MVDINFKSKFYNNFILFNNLEKKDFKEFIFYKGMLFRDKNKWWDMNGERISSHEGIDLLYYSDGAGYIKKLTPGAIIPVIQEGVVAAIIDDILGKSIFIRHNISRGERRLYTVYAHVKPLKGITIGNELTANAKIAAINKLPDKKYKILPHLHISAAWIPDSLMPVHINWEVMGNPGIVSLINPLETFDIPYRIIGSI